VVSVCVSLVFVGLVLGGRHGLTVGLVGLFIRRCCIGPGRPCSLFYILVT
jgi:hypothetical protein